MSKADEIFEKELNSEKVIEVDRDREKIACIGYRFKDKQYGEDNIDECWVVFLVQSHHIVINCCVGMEELQAINEKVKELGWLDE